MKKREGMLRSFFAKGNMDSVIKSANTTKAESWLGYFLGPCLVGVTYCMLGGSYLTQFYTDVLGIAGPVLAFMPFWSKIFDAITNIIMGQIIDRTRTKQGKARPWIFIAGILITISGILLYTVPRAGTRVQLIWIIVSYNLFFAFSYTIYAMSHTLMVPLSTRNTKQRDTLALMSNAGVSIIPGMIGNIIMPFLVARIGVGTDAQGSWIKVMSIIAIAVIPGTLMEYYFTKERITEEAMKAEGVETETKTLSFKEQAKVAVHDKYWMIVMICAAVMFVSSLLTTNSMVYFCNWVLADSVKAGANAQFLVNVIGQAPLGIGIFLLWPLVRKFGKRRVIQVGFSFSAIGALFVAVAAFMELGMGAVLGGLIIKSIGFIPNYVISAQLAEAMDHIEWKRGVRVDGFSASVYSIIMTVSNGIGQSILLFGINAFGYIVPSSSTEQIDQPLPIKLFFIFCFAIAPMICSLVVALFMFAFDIEKKMPQISVEMDERHRQEALARGEIYHTPQEIEEMERAESERLAEENRIKELREKCEKKGLSFEEEEKKYQQALEAKRRKNEKKRRK